MLPRVVIALLILLAAASGEDRVLNLLCWSEYVPQAVIEGFTKKSGARVAMENYNSNEQMLAKLREQPRHYDLVQPSQFYVETLAKTGGLEPLDLARIPNLANIDSRYRSLPHDPEGRFSVPWLAGTVGIVVNTERVKEPVQTWADVFAGKYAGRIVVVDDAREMVAWALASLGLPIAEVGDANLTRIKPVLERWLPQVKVFDSDSPKTALLSGGADIGIVWSGEAALLWQRDHKFQYVLPAEGAHGFMDNLAIPHGAPHQALAEDFIDYCLDPQVSALISREYPYTNPNRAARHLLTPEQLANPASYPTGEPHLDSLHNVGNTPEAVNAFVEKIRASRPAPAELPDLTSIPADLTTPPMTFDAPAAGRRVRQTTAGWKGTEAHHALYLPTNWKPGGKFPVLVEYAGNGGYLNRFGDESHGTVEGSNLGFGLSAGADYIWVCMPFLEISAGRVCNAEKWWGDADATVKYCLATVLAVCRNYGGDAGAVVLCGFSRGAVACNYIGLRDDRIASLWRAFLCHSNYDGVREWPYPQSDRASALERLQRLNGRPQFISQEGSTADIRRYLEGTGVSAPFTFVDVPFRNHSDQWTLRECAPRRAAREWLKSLGLPAPISAPPSSP